MQPVSRRDPTPVPHTDRRRAERVSVGFKLAISAKNPVNGGEILGPGILEDLSISGARVTTRHQLTPGQSVKVTIPTEGCPDALGLPERLAGKAVVQRVEPRKNRTRHVALRFTPALAQNMDFAFYIAYLLGRHAQAALA